MLMPKLRTALTISASAWLLGACSGEPTCDYSTEAYVTAQSVPTLRAPEGLSTPDRSSTLVIPTPAAEAKPIPIGKGRCLDRPPSYFSKTPEKTPEQPERPEQSEKKDAEKTQ